MIKQLIAIMVVAASATASATPIDVRNDVQIHRNTLGSGSQGEGGFEPSTLVHGNDIFHAPQFLPYHPTAGTIYPRVVEVKCVRTHRTVQVHSDVIENYSMPAGLKCEGYNWLPKLGRGEYLYFKPVIVDPTPPVVRERVIIKEVPIKKIGE